MTRDVVRTLLALCLCGSLGACGDDSGGGGGADAAIDPNTGDYHEYVLSELTLPDSGNSASYAFNLDGIDDTADNKLGAILGLIPGDLQGSVDGSIASGSLVLLSALRADTLTSDPAALWQVWLGNSATAAPTPGASYTVNPAGPTDAKVTGAINASGTFEGKDGTVPLSIPLIQGAAPLNVTLYGAAVRVKVSATDYTDTSATDLGRLGGAIKQEDLMTDVLPAVAAFATMEIQGDQYPADGTPDCTCAAGSRTCQMSDATPAQIANLLDANEDCMVTAEELGMNATLRAVLQPDVDLFDSTGAYHPGTEGEEGYDSLSLGVGIKGISAMFSH